MKKNELVWRELVDAAIERGERRWDSVDDLAFRAGVIPSTAAYALRRLVEIGAIRQHFSGFSVINPDKALTMFCSARSVEGDALASLAVPVENLERILDTLVRDGAILGGASAAVALLGGANVVSDYSEYVLYVRDESSQATLVDLQREYGLPKKHNGHRRHRGNLVCLRADPRAARNWQRYTSFAQTYADLFVTPGWQASEFRMALHDRYLAKRDWDQG